MKLLYHYFETTRHKVHILRFMLRVCVALMKRAVVHDLTKYQKVEAKAFSEVSADFKGISFGSEDYQARLDRLENALTHHYRHNPHHPEHHPGGVGGMGILDIVEMLVDWKSSSLRHDDGDIETSIRMSQKRFGFSDGTASKFRKFYEEVL